MGDNREHIAHPRDYAEIRNSVHNGDLLLFQGTSWASKAIRWITGSKYSHVGVAMWWQPPGCRRRLLVLESVRKGIVCSPASKAIDHYSGQVDWYELTDEARAACPLAELFALCMQQIGKGYGYLALAMFGLRLVLAKLSFGYLGGNSGTDERNPKAMFCSWFVSHVFARAGCKLAPRLRNRLTSPKHIAQSEVTLYAGTLHWNPETAPARFPELAANARQDSAL